MTVLDTLRVPIVQAPMAGGVSTPALAAAVCEAGGLGFLAAGYLSPGALREQIQAMRRLTRRPFGVNIFVPDDPVTDVEALARYRDRLEAEAALYGVRLGEPLGGDDGWTEKLAVVRDCRVAVVSFAFGCPSRATVSQLRTNGSEVVVTVTSADEARLAAGAGADVLCVQGPEAGAHRGTFRNTGAAPDIGLIPLLRRVSAAVELPLIATGGLAHGADVAAVLAAGARAAQLGTVFIPCPESGANPTYKAAITDPPFPGTAVTRAFTGRPARGLVNRFLLDHSAAAPAAYPHVHQLTRNLRAAAAKSGDPEVMSLWAGQGYPFARELPAGELVATLAEQARTAIADAARRIGG
ncbi:MAG TPA: nitronate monooxygenase [Actinophytocola sp.]|uniref:nitronate monooxygenase n=1 Tax=Actinophytocola sp. TaxID=1872138 RepID=UPI002DBB8253|nr:nitronate monooxygenase [Actinophytocola sp.]HEU5473831.1 nitronate monooxygenase [Actinophytocola sp.]